MIADMVFMLFMLTTAILILWLTSNAMINSKKISIFLPFFFYGILLCLSAAFSFYGIVDQKAWFAIEFTWTLLLLWVFINLRRENENN